MQKNRLWVWKESYKLERFEFINTFFFPFNIGIFRFDLRRIFATVC